MKLVKVGANNLSSSDLEQAREHGIPILSEGEFWLGEGTNCIELTAKGFAYFAETSRVHSVPFEFKNSYTREEIDRFRYRVACVIDVVAKREIAAALDAGSVAPKDRALFTAFVYGDDHEVLSVAKLHNALAGADNVIPFFKKHAQ